MRYDAIMAEMVTRGVRLESEKIRSLYFGGGTPSKLGGEGLGALLRRFAQSLDVDELSTFEHPREITMEVNPEDVSEAAVASWAAAGVNRASLGVQSFDASVLSWMHREHSPEDAGRAVEQLRGGGIENISLDLIFALPDSLQRDWERDLDLALSLSPDHLSFYGLTVEPKTPLGRWAARGEVTEAPEERFEREFLLAHARLTNAGFEHYEVSNYGLPGRRALHNSAYWSGASYLGLGPSAHGFDGRTRRWNVSAYAAWEDAVSTGSDPVAGSEVIGESERQAEEVYLGLRTTDGLAIHQSDEKTVSPWIDAGWAVRDADRVVLTPLGWLRLDAIAATLTSARSRSTLQRMLR